MKEIIYGTKEFPEKIDITDPCYDKDVWCRINNFPIKPGEYTCYACIADNEETRGWGERVSRIGIRMGDADRYERKGLIGVDAGLAGFFIDKPDYNSAEWKEFCGKINFDQRVYLFDEGFFSESGYGDGAYNVYAGYKDGNIVEVYIEFIGEEDD